MNIETALAEHPLILTEAAVIESLRRSGSVQLHPHLENAPLIYEETGRQAISGLYRGFIEVAAGAGVPITLCTPTWRANRERIEQSGIETDLNGDAVAFLHRIRSGVGGWASSTFVGGLVGCRNDCYQPRQGLDEETAIAFHSWQIDRLAEAGVDFLLAATLPALPEAAGIARAMAGTGTPYIISFVIDRQGKLLDGSTLAEAFETIDSACEHPPLGFMINCAYPSFLNAPSQSEAALDRLIGFQGNASSLDHAELDGATELHADDIRDWGRRMIEMNRTYGVKILGGCCGTTVAHLQYLTSDLAGRKSPAEGTR